MNTGSVFYLANGQVPVHCTLEQVLRALRRMLAVATDDEVWELVYRRWGNCAPPHARAGPHVPLPLISTMLTLAHIDYLSPRGRRDAQADERKVRALLDRES